MANRNKYTPRKIGTIIDAVHIVIGILVVVMSVFAILNPEKYMFLFPLIFFFAAVLSLVTAWFTYLTGKRGARRKPVWIIYLVLVILLLILTVISAISIWGSS